MNGIDKNGFDKQLADKFKDFSPKVPTGLWDKIEAALEQEQPTKVVHIHKKSSLRTWWITIAATLLVISATAYWFNRPIEVTYLQGMAHKEAALPPEVATPPVKQPQVVAEPLDMDRLKRVLARRQKKSPSIVKSSFTPAVDSAVKPTVTATSNSLAMAKPVELKKNTAVHPEPLPTLNADDASPTFSLVAVPDVQPLVVFEEEEETMLATTEVSKQRFGISNILNYVVGTVDQRDEKIVTFSNDDEGSLKLDFNFNLAKNRKKKL